MKKKEELIFHVNFLYWEKNDDYLIDIVNFIVFIEMIEIYGLSCYFDHKYDTTVAPPIWLTKSFPNFELS